MAQFSSLVYEFIVSLLAVHESDVREGEEVDHRQDARAGRLFHLDRES